MSVKCKVALADYFAALWQPVLWALITAICDWAETAIEVTCLVHVGDPPFVPYPYASSSTTDERIAM